MWYYVFHSSEGQRAPFMCSIIFYQISIEKSNTSNVKNLTEGLLSFRFKYTTIIFPAQGQRSLEQLLLFHFYTLHYCKPLNKFISSSSSLLHAELVKSNALKRRKWQWKAEDYNKYKIVLGRAISFQVLLVAKITEMFVRYVNHKENMGSCPICRHWSFCILLNLT